jgi:hypothetical protein
MTPNFVLVAALVSLLGAWRARRLALARRHDSARDLDAPDVEQFHSPDRRRLVVRAPGLDSWAALERLARALAVDHRVHVVLVRSGPASLLYAVDARGWSGDDDVVWGRWLDGRGELVRYADLRASDARDASDEES